MDMIVNWLVASLVILSASYVFSGIKADNFLIALVAAVVLGFINMIIRPVLLILTLPINIVTLGLFTFSLNALLVMLTSALVPVFEVSSFWWALLLSILLSIANLALASKRSNFEKHK